MYIMTEVIYKIYCKDETITDCYVGSTDNFDRRCGEHIKRCNNQNSKEYNKKVYKYIRDHGGFDNFIIEPIIECDESNRYEAEVHYFLQLNAKLNTYWPRRSKKQYYNDNKEHIAETKKQHYIDNRELITEKAKTKIQCDCGVSYSYNNKTQHYRSQKHQNYILTK